MAVATNFKTSTLLAILTTTLVFAVAAPVQAQLSRQERNCKYLLTKKIARAGLAKVLVARAKCEDAKMVGDLPATVDCTAEPPVAGGPGSGSATLDEKLTQLFVRRNKMAISMNNKCGTDPVVLPSSLGMDVICALPSESWGDITVCGFDLMKDAAARLLDIAYRDTSVVANFDERQCRSTIANSLRRVVRARMRTRKDCLRAADKGTAGLDCRATVAWPGRVVATGYRRADRRLGDPLSNMFDDIVENCDIDLAAAGFPNLDLLDRTQGDAFTYVDLFHDLNDVVLSEESLFLNIFFSATALDPYCGNALLDPGEQCDDGNRISCDGCDRDCTFTPSCGNGSACGDSITTFETCDDGNLVAADGCSVFCDNEADNCGNGLVEIALGESCDDGNAVDCDGCDSNCTLSLLCNNGAVCGAEQCDLGLGTCVGGADEFSSCFTDADCRGQCASGPNKGIACTNDTDCDPTGAHQCAPAGGCGGVCAGGAENASVCLSDADCTGFCTAANFGSSCLIDSNCGVGGLCGFGGTCTIPTLGNSCLSDLACGDGGSCQLGTCMTGNSDTAADRCRADCTLPVCGDGVTDPGFGETCDDGNAVEGDGCDSNCTPTGCNNGIVTAGEQCDEGAGVCIDGPSIGAPCLADSDCLGTCAAGPNFGASCSADTAIVECAGFACTLSLGCSGGNVTSATCTLSCTLQATTTTTTTTIATTTTTTTTTTVGLPFP